ncbi:glycosyltransferase involved in cell wall biosynthesis [Azospirillum canadense]|nr:glycosyltransferase involved in cell wall biosynthesis [Azospirillum canadense]
MDELIAALRRQGHETIIVGPARIANERFGCGAGSVELLKRLLPRWAYELLEVGYNLVAWRRLARAVREHRPDAIYERYNLFLLCGPWVARRFGLPLLLEVNAPLCEERARHAGLSLKRLARFCERWIWHAANVALPVTHVLAGEVRARGVPAERISVVPNGIDRHRFPSNVDGSAAKRKLGLEGRLVLGFTGFVRAWHGLEEVVALLGELGERHNAHLLLVGDGPAREDLERCADALGVRHRLTVTGVIDRDEVTDHIAAFDIALQPAVTPYASPLKLFEYMALGRAILAPDTPNIREVLTDGQDALLFDPERPDTRAAAIRRLCADADLRQRIAEQASATIDRCAFTWDRNAERIVQMIQQHAADHTGVSSFAPAPLRLQR